jgi:hypothetical protein
MIGRRALVGRAKAQRIPAKVVEDEEYQVLHERSCGIDIAKDKADVCVRLPPAREGGRRRSSVETLPSVWREITALGERLIGQGVEVVVMEAASDYVRCDGAWVQVGGAAGGRFRP